MRRVLLRNAIKLNKSHKRRQWWQRLVRMMAMVVVFCTTYALILPAITMQAEPACGIEEHSHSESCYTAALNCVLPPETVVVHQHGDSCFDDAGHLICMLPELAEHQHDTACWQTEQRLNCPVTHIHSEVCTKTERELTCTLPEQEAHVHGESCMVQQPVLICQQAEQEGHTHGEGCYELQTGHCPILETEGHTHTDGCYTLRSIPCTEPDVQSHVHDGTCYETAEELACGKEEIQLHTHEAGCYDAQGQLACGMPQVAAHVHGEGCRADAQQVLTCTQEEHIHGDGCYLEEEQSAGALEYLCGFASHLHLESCYGEAGTLVCSIPEHTHDAVCVIADLDLTADVQTPEQWETELSQLVLTGNWQEDLLTIAASQLGYRESSRNVILKEDTLKGYTRYGAKYGDPYGDWNALYAAFCLHYAGVSQEILPLNADSQKWMELLQEKEWIKEHLEDPAPGTGALVFFKNTESETVYAGIAYLYVPQEGEEQEAELRILAGDVQDKVTEQNLDNLELLGFCDIGAALAESELGEAVETQTLPQQVVQTAQTENYTVTVSYSSELVLPEGAQLRVTEYGRESEIFRQRCQEAGYELEWLLNIGFFVEEAELDLDGAFDVVVASKQGALLGQDITHFTEDGTQRISAADASETVQDGQTAVAFAADGFSDFGGGIALAAETGTYTFVTADPANLQEGMDYALHFGSNDNFTFLSNTNSSLGTISVPGTGYYYSPVNIGQSWSLTDAQMGNADIKQFTWRIEKTGDKYYLVSQNGGQRLAFNSRVWMETDGYQLSNTFISGAGCRITSQLYYTYYLRNSNGSWEGTWRSSSATTMYFAAVTAAGDSGGTTDPTPPAPTVTDHPDPVHTDMTTIDRLRFYNVCENGDKGVSPLAGCIFQIEQIDDAGNVIPGGYSTTLTSGDTVEVLLPEDIPLGHYRITEVSAPPGFMRDTDFIRTFRVGWSEAGQTKVLTSEENIGTFINHHKEQLLTTKTGEVEDYNNRIYQILLAAESHMRVFEMDPVDVLFVVDQSNSMLFPAGLTSTGKQVTLRLDGNNNVNNMENLNLDKSKVHYVISDPNGTSTVWALWYDENAKTWMYQDASYYAKAWHNVYGSDACASCSYIDPDNDGEEAIFPENRSYNDQAKAEADNVRSNGGGLGYSLSGAGIGNYIDTFSGDQATFTVYTASSEYNRLHYMEDALSNMIYQLADMNPKNRVTLTEFTKVVNASDDLGPYELTTTNVETLIREITTISTGGGTRQDIALKHTYENHLNNTDDLYNKGIDKTYTILVTDGAPVRSSGSVPDKLGTPGDEATTDGNTIYGQIKGWANEVKKKSTLMTVALGMGEVKGGSAVLQEIASTSKFYCALDDAAALVKSMQELMFDAFKAKDLIPVTGEITDEISDSFYPVAWVSKGAGAATGRQVLTSDNARDWILLEPGDWITLDGGYTTQGASGAVGQLSRKDDGTFCIRWSGLQFSDPYGNIPSDYRWKGTFYVKAKEDFIGGNAIDTNKSCIVESMAHYEDNPYEVRQLDTPTVNVHLLDMNEHSSEVTVYLGDIVNGPDDSPLDSLKEFYNQTKVRKILPGDGNVLNKTDSAEGLETAEFYLKYAIGRDLTDDEWVRLMAGEPLNFPYTYDDPSSHGAVGYFTFRLEKTGGTADYAEHEAQSACQPNGAPLTEACTTPAESYTLHVTYTAYRLNESGRPQTTVNNGTGSPGTEVGTGYTLATGKGTVEKHNVHEAHVISGRIELEKVMDPRTEPPAEDQTFSFTLHRMEDGENTQNDVVKTITVPAGTLQGGTVRFDGLRRGTYVVTETETEAYMLKEVRVLGTTNCYSTPAPGEAAKSAAFYMGNNKTVTEAFPTGQNVIGKAAGADRYTSYVDPVNGVYGKAVFTNSDITGQIPVEKVWDDGAQSHSGDAVYVLLYLDGEPATITPRDGGESCHRLLRLDASNNWKGSFTVGLSGKTDSVANYNYTVREVSQAIALANAPEGLANWTPALLENDGQTQMMYKAPLESGSVLGVRGRAYVVWYTQEESGGWTVTNSRGVELPKTGGRGTFHYTFGGGLLMAASAIMYLCINGRKRRKGGR